MASCFQPPAAPSDVEGAEIGSVGDIAPVFVFSQQVSRSQALVLWEGLRDQFDANRALCLNLLTELPVDTLLVEVSRSEDTTASLSAKLYLLRSAG